MRFTWFYYQNIAVHVLCAPKKEHNIGGGDVQLRFTWSGLVSSRSAIKEIKVLLYLTWLFDAPKLSTINR